jgi:hypothetical protein
MHNGSTTGAGSLRSRTDDAAVGPEDQMGVAFPLPLFDDLSVCLLHELAHFRERLPASALKFLDLLVDLEAVSTATGLFMYSSNSLHLFSCAPRNIERRQVNPDSLCGLD